MSASQGRTKTGKCVLRTQGSNPRFFPEPQVSLAREVTRIPAIGEQGVVAAPQHPGRLTKFGILGEQGGHRAWFALQVQVPPTAAIADEDEAPLFDPGGLHHGFILPSSHLRFRGLSILSSPTLSVFCYFIRDFGPVGNEVNWEGSALLGLFESSSAVWMQEICNFWDQRIVKTRKMG